MKFNSSIVFAALLAPGVSGIAFAADNMPAPTGSLAGTVWGPAPPVLPAGAQLAVMTGDPSKAGFVSLRLKMPANYVIPPHFHPTDEHAVALADGEWKPSFALTGNLQYQQDAVNTQFLDATNRSYAVGFAMRIPLFAAPGAMARKATAEAQVRQARNGLDAAIDNGRLEITSAYTEWEAAQELVDAQRKALDLARESLSIAQVSYENGLITSIELSDARQSLIETEWNLAQAKFAQILAAAKTRYAAGI